MAATNGTFSDVSEFQLICFPGMQSWQRWLSMALAFLFLVALGANITLITTICAAPSLHQPLYYTLCLLALLDLLISLSVSPKTLAILWFDDKTISSAACLTQMFLLYFSQGMESSIFLFLAYDRYIAICKPLSYISIVTNKMAAQAVVLSLTINTMLFLPFPFLVSRLHYCGTNAVTNCICNSLDLAKLACEDTAVNYMYPLVLISFTLVIHLLVMTFSYTMIIRAVLRLGSSKSALKALSTCSSHLIVIGFVYCLITVTAISSRVKESIPHYVNLLLGILRFVTPPALTPLVYGIRTQVIRHAFKNLLRKARPLYGHN